MSIWNILLRVLLSAALLFNGTATAVASVLVAHEPVPQAARQVNPTGAPCHQPSQQDSIASAEISAGLPVPVSDSESGNLLPDCCKSSACGCACVHPVSAAVSMMAVVSALVEHTRSVRPTALGHATPVLPHLIRPPIG